MQSKTEDISPPVYNGAIGSGSGPAFQILGYPNGSFGLPPLPPFYPPALFPYGLIPGYPHAVPPQHQPITPKRSQEKIMDITSPGDGVDYPTVADFLAEVKLWPEACKCSNLDQISNIFMEHEIYLLNKLKGMRKEDYQNTFGFKFGTAQFLEMIIAKAINEVKKKNAIP